MAHTIGTNLGAAAGAAPTPTGVFGKVRCVIVNILEKLVIWQERAEQRHALGELSEHMLKDIGVSASDAYGEARKPFWMP